MFQPNYIFGLNKKLLVDNPGIYQGVVVMGSQSYSIGMGTPCIGLVYPRNRISGSSEIHPHFLVFPFAQYGTKPRKVYNNFDDTPMVIKFTEDANIIDRSKILNIDKLDEDQILRSIEYVKNVGPLVLPMDYESRNELTDDLLEMIKLLGKKFKWSSLLHKEYYGSLGLRPGETILFVLTLANIDQCLPVYDSKKVDGVVINGVGYYPEKSEKSDKLVSCCEFTMAFSNFTYGFTYIDGQKLRNKLTSIDLLKKVISECREYLSDIRKSTVKEEKIEEEGLVTMGSYPSVTASNTQHVFSNLTTTCTS